MLQQFESTKYVQIKALNGILDGFKRKNALAGMRVAVPGSALGANSSREQVQAREDLSLLRVSGPTAIYAIELPT